MQASMPEGSRISVQPLHGLILKGGGRQAPRVQPNGELWLRLALLLHRRQRFSKKGRRWAGGVT